MLENEWGHSFQAAINPQNSIFQAETLAISQSARKLIDSNKQNNTIYFMSDSTATIKSLTKNKINSYTTWDCINTLNELGKSNTIHINWIPGHRGFDGNEIADTWAKNGAKIRPLQSWHRIPHSELIKNIKNHHKNEHITRWSGTALSKHAKTLINILIKAANYNIHKLQKVITNLKTNQIKTLTKTITGHNCLKYHMEKIGYCFDSDCYYCPKLEYQTLYEEETAIHILTDCTAFSNLRQQIYGQTTLKDDDLIMTNLKTTIKKIITFMDKTKALSKKIEIDKNQLSPYRPKKRKNINQNIPNEEETPKRQKNITQYYT